jgi:hypothetical protein
MAGGMDFDRRAFIPREEPPPSLVSQLGGLVGILVAIIAIGAVAILGYKFAVSSPIETSEQTESLHEMQQRLVDMQARLDDLEKHHRVSIIEPAAPPAKAEAPVPAAPTRPARPAYNIYSASVMKPIAPPPPPAASLAAPAPRPASTATDDAIAANHEAWEATTDRLADVVGVVGSQQGELIQTRDQLNQLLAQTQRTAMQFELRRGTDRQPVGPVSLALKGADTQRQRYTMYVYVSDQCIELKDRSIDEVVTFTVSPGHTPLELIATKVSRNAIVGYLEVPKQ